MSTTASATQPLHGGNQQGVALSWVASVLVALCSLVASFFLSHSVGVFEALFQGLQVDLPAPTRFLISAHTWLIPSFLVALAVLVLLKEVLLRDVRNRLGATLVIFIVFLCCAGFVQYVINLPLLQLIQKLNATK